MTTELIIMAVSGLGMAALLVHKHLENTRGLETRVRDMREKADPILEGIHQTTSRAVSRVTLGNAALVVNRAAVHAVKLVMDVSHRAHRVSAAFVEKASQKTEDLSKAGAASFYLKQIKESRDEAQTAPRSTTEAEEQ